jgi:signal transduction histidine kinase
VTPRRNIGLATYTILVEAAAIAALFLLPARQLAGEPVMLFVMVSLAAAVSARPIRIPALRMEVMAGDAFIFATMATLGGLPAVLAAVASVVGSALGVQPRPAPRRTLFNFATMSLGATLGYLSLARLGGGPDQPFSQQVFPLFVASTVYFLVNTWLVTGAIVLERNVPLFSTWRRSGLWTAVSNYSGLTLAAVLVLILNTLGPWGLTLGVPPAWLLVSFYRSHKERLEEQQRRLKQITVLNTQLEAKVAERTQELKGALDHVEEANRQLRMINDRLAEASRTKSAFLAGVSHELRTPLNAIIGFSELLDEQNFGTLSDEQRAFVKDIRDSGVHLLTLINDILDLSKIESGRMDLNLEEVDLHIVLEEALVMVQPQAVKKGLDLTLEIGHDVAAGRLDPGKVRQIIVNLLGNAIKFTGAGGQVGIRASREDQDLVVEVYDTGVGISPEEQDKIFREFYQVDSSLGRKAQGTGLGLALVRRLVHLHGGSIDVESEVGVGSSFTLKLPGCAIDRPAEGEVKQPYGMATAVDETCTILVVEDNAVNRRLAINVLKSRGHRIEVAETGEEALKFLTEELPDLILMDVQLPGMDGLEVTRRVKADPATRQIPVIALSAHARDADVEKAKEAGCDGFIPKPIRLNRFPDQVRSYLEAAVRVA